MTSPVKFTCSAKDLASAVSAAGKVVNLHTTIPILSNVLLTTDGERVLVRATDLELTLEVALPANISEGGSVTVPAKLFGGYLGNLPAGTLDFSGSSTRASVRASRSNYDFHALPAEEYPPLPPAARGTSFTLASRSLRDAINAVVFAASNEEARGAVLMGTLLEVEGSCLTMVSTDGYRLAKRSLMLARGVDEPLKLVVPSRALSEAARNLGSGDREIALSILGSAGNQLSITAGETVIVVRLVDGTYPNYAQVIPQNFDRSIIVETAALIGSLKRAELVAGDRASMVKLSVAEQQLTLTATSDTTGNAYEELEVEQSGPDLAIAFNARYLLDILNRVDSPQVVMEFLGPLSPAAIRPMPIEGEMRQMYVLMPLRQ
jgi:DNA polymerase-3 subunit beta